MRRVAPSAHHAKAPVLITGGCGFIGCNLANALATRGRSVVVLDSFARAGAQENRDWLVARHRNWIELESGDVRDADTVDALIARAGAVLHLAGQVAVTTSLDNPKEDFAVNAGGTLNVLEAVRRHNPSAPVLFASTNKVYGRLLSSGEVQRKGERYEPRDLQHNSGVTENAPLDFYSPYGCSKGAADQYVLDYARVFGLRTAVLRMSCIYGARQFGTEDQGWVAHFVKQAITGKPITVYGDGCQVRDILYVDDAAEAWLGALANIDSVSGRVFNLGGGLDNALSLRELLGHIACATGQRPQVRFDAWRPGDQPWYVSDTTAIREAIGWAPHTGVMEGLAALRHWLTWRFAEPTEEAALLEANA